VAPAISHKGRGAALAFARASQNLATMAMLLDTLPTPSVDGVDRLYHHMGEILTIAIAHEAECSL
jgi:hypothetical protein